MMNRTTKLVLTTSTLFLAFLVGRPDTASAGSQSSTVTVTTTVGASCTIGTGSIAFPPYDPVNTHATNPDNQSGTIVVRCTNGATGITIDLGVGSNNPTNGQRRMTNGSAFLNYEIYQDASFNTKWGVSDGGSLRSGTDLNGTGGDVTVTMYGTIPPAQLSATAGSYKDTVASTINF